MLGHRKPVETQWRHRAVNTVISNTNFALTAVLFHDGRVFLFRHKRPLIHARLQACTCGHSGLHHALENLHDSTDTITKHACVLEGEERQGTSGSNLSLSFVSPSLSFGFSQVSRCLFFLCHGPVCVIAAGPENMNISTRCGTQDDHEHLEHLRNMGNMFKQ